MSDTSAPVIVIDLQTGMFDGVAEPPLANADRVVANARAVIDWARRTGRPLAFVRTLYQRAVGNCRHFSTFGTALFRLFCAARAFPRLTVAPAHP